jgi:hypothetical protein
VNGARPIVEQLLLSEELALGALASRRAVVRWSDGTVGECARWCADEVLICEGDLGGRTREQIRALRFRRDRDWMRS